MLSGKGVVRDEFSDDDTSAVSVSEYRLGGGN